jgi:hypothetical protein
MECCKCGITLADLPSGFFIDEDDVFAFIDGDFYCMACLYAYGPAPEEEVEDYGQI